MASFGKKLLSAFVEMEDTPPDTPAQTQASPAFPAATASPHATPAAKPVSNEATHKFSEHFEKLFADANLPGPGYHEFSKMTEAMQAIPNEQARYCAAFAGLHVQGLDKQKLLTSAQDYLQLLAADAAAFHQTIDAALTEKVKGKKAEVEQAKARIQKLSEEILQLQQLMQTQEQEIADNEAKLDNNAAGYDAALLAKKDQLMADIEKIKQHII